MIFGVGTDIIEIARIEKAAQSDRFLNKVFTEGERRYCGGKAFPAPSLAVRFAAKEAVFKALYPHVRTLIWREIEVVQTDSRKPGVRLGGATAAVAEELGVKAIHLSLSHDRSTAQAFAVAEI